METVLGLAALAFVAWMIRKGMKAASSSSTPPNVQPHFPVRSAAKALRTPSTAPPRASAGSTARPPTLSTPVAHSREAEVLSKMEAFANQDIPRARVPEVVRPAATAPARPPVPHSRWIPQDEVVSIAGLSIPGGLLYVGNGLRAISGVETEPALISPGLRVALSHPDLSGAGMSYWPSYADISPEARAAYLLWLSAGRRAPDAYIGYVFLFYYGLERRVLGDQARQDIPIIVAEVRALLEVYSSSRSFCSYARGFLDVCAALTDLSSLDDTESVSGGLPLALRVRLARLSSARQAVPAEAALQWLEGASPLVRRSAVERCPTEFRQLFQIRYRERYGDGLVVEPNKTRLSVSYKPASRSFYRETSVDIGDLPDVTVLQRPLKELEKVADSCIEELDPYSRWLGKNPDGRGSPEAIALLPSAMAMSHAGVEMRVLANWLEATVTGETPSLLKRAELMARWPSKRVQETAERKSWVEVAKVLQMLGYGIEPDVRFQGLIGCRTDNVVLFKFGSEQAEAATPEYLLATLMARFGVVIAAADGNISADEISRLAAMLDEKLELAPPEQLRLAAHLKLLVAEGASLSGAKKKLDDVAIKQREAIAHVATLVALADGRVTKEESASLGKIYALLGLEPKRVYQDLHNLGVESGTPDSDVVTVKQPSSGQTGFSIPPPPKPVDPHRVVLDKARLQARAMETSEVAAILKGVFVDEEPATPQPSRPNVAVVAGLDGSHSSLVRRLVDLTKVGRADWESWCSQCGLLPDGAIDRINEAAWDTSGGPLLDGEDTISVDQAALKEMLA